MTTTITEVPGWIAEAVLAKAEAMQADLGLPVVLPEQEEDFTTPEDGRYVVFDYLPNVPAWESLAAGGSTVEQGILNASVIWPIRHGLIGPMNDAGRVKSYFARHSTLIAGPVRVKIESVRIAPPLTGGIDRLSVPVTINWTATAV